ncbi:MFS transporter [Ktedonobacteria bacterium brp13]|nr:MFS transporter [Ktedonobacteria bacterium brp13]
MGLVLTALSIPQVIFLLIGGVVADRVPRRLILFLADISRALMVLLVAVFSYFHWLQFWHLIALSFLFGVASGFFFPAYQAIPPQLVPQDARTSANTLTALSRQLGLLIGPLLGAGAVALAGPTSAFAFDGISFALSACCILAMRLVRQRTPPSPSSFLAQSNQEIRHGTIKRQSTLKKAGGDLYAGLLYVTQIPWIWITIVLFALGNVCLSSPMQVSLPKLVHDTYQVGIWFLGVLGTASACGAMIGSLVIGQFPSPRRRGLIAYLSIALSGLGTIALGWAWLMPPFLERMIAILACLCFGTGIGVFGVIWISLLQERVPIDMQGRVFSIDGLGSFCLLPIGYALVGLLTDRIGPSLTFVCGGLGALILVGIALSVRTIRLLD